jgi:mono/diheme cytochrome c family protein
MKRSSLTYIFALAVAAMSMTACQSGGEFTGREYMPDMAHSIAYESNQNTFYSFNHWGGEEAYDKFVQPRKPAQGTVAFGRSKEEVAVNSPYTYPVYAFGNTEDERTQATNLILDNPIRPKNAAELENVLGKGKELYEIYCGSCHGKAGDGNGQLYESGVYPAAPKNFLLDDIVQSSEGRYYHAIMHGKNVMLSHADKLSHDERWMVIHYIRSLQAAKAGTEYNVAAANAPKGQKPEPKAEDKDAKKGEKKDPKKGK